jgi:Calcium-dependent channel, 7TM region, putative phosphate
MAFLASLSSVGALKESVPLIAELLAAAPFLEPVFQLLAPLLVPIVNSLLPSILGFLSSLEGPVSGAVNGASTFGKLASFMIIQTFFVRYGRMRL